MTRDHMITHQGFISKTSLGHNPSTRLMSMEHKVNVYGKNILWTIEIDRPKDTQAVSAFVICIRFE